MVTISKTADIAAASDGSIYVLSPLDDDFILPDPISPSYPFFKCTGRIIVIDSRTYLTTFQ
jgi:hypothetical protein